MTRKLLKVVMVLCVVAGIASFIMLLPQVREMIIGLGERYVGRPLTHDVWHRRLVIYEKLFLMFDIMLIVFVALIPNLRTDTIKKLNRGLANCIAIHGFKKWIGISATIFLIAHGYRFFNALYNHDSLMIFQNDVGWQISLGRFLLPIYLRVFRGRIAAPWLIGCMSFVFLMVSAYLILNLLNIRSVKNMCVATAMLLTATTFTLLNATYIMCSDIYMFALLLAVFGAYIAIRHSRHFMVSVVCLSLSMGLYQSYIQVAVILLLFDVFADVLKNKSVKNILKKCAAYLCNLAVALILYWCLVKLFQKICQIPMSDSYNGLSNVGHYAGVRSILRCFIGSYVYVLRSFINPITAHKIYSIIARFTILFSAIWAICRILEKRNLSRINILFAVMLMVLFPFGVNFVYFISQGMEHDLMTFSFTVVPLFIFPLLSANEELGDEEFFKKN